MTTLAPPGPASSPALASNGAATVAFAAGLVAAVNPCGFAMLPAYLAYFLGLEGSDADVPRASVAQALRVACAVAAGFLAVFAVAGTAVKLTSLPVYETVPWISIVIGLALLALAARRKGEADRAAALLGVQPPKNFVIHARRFHF